MNIYYFLVILSALLNTIANLFIKTGADKIKYTPQNFTEIFPFIYRLLANFYLVAGLIFFGIGFLLWVMILNKIQLSIAAPIMSLGYVFIIIFSYFLFKEPISLSRISGTVIIIIGIILVTR